VFTEHGESQVKSNLFVEFQVHFFECNCYHKVFASANPLY